MRTSNYMALAAIALFSLSNIAFAQRGGGGMRRGGGNYNPATEVTLTGVVDEVKHIPAAGRGPGGLHLVLRSEGGVLEVHVGPSAFVTAKNFEFANGDAITVIGSRVKMAGQDVVIAREIKKGKTTLVLRDSSGLPLWSGRARR